MWSTEAGLHVGGKGVKLCIDGMVRRDDGICAVGEAIPLPDAPVCCLPVTGVYCCLHDVYCLPDASVYCLAYSTESPATFPRIWSGPSRESVALV